MFPKEWGIYRLLFAKKSVSKVKATESFIARLIDKSEIPNILDYKTIQKIIGR